MHVQLFPQPNAQSFTIFFSHWKEKRMIFVQSIYMTICRIECIREMICASDTLNVFILCLIFQWIPYAWRKIISWSNKRLRIECINGVCGSHAILINPNHFNVRTQLTNAEHWFQWSFSFLLIWTRDFPTIVFWTNMQTKC